MFPQPDMWKKCLDCIEELQTILFEHNNIFIGENIAEDSENLANTDQVCSWICNKYDDVSCFSEKLAARFCTFTTAMAASGWALIRMAYRIWKTSPTFLRCCYSSV